MAKKKIVKKNARKPNTVDVYIGANIRKIRLLKNMTQSDLAIQIGVRFQQVQKYETAQNRVGASRLLQISEAFEVPVSRLFGKYAEQESDFMKQMDEKRILKLVGYYQSMSEKEQEQFFDDAKFLAGKG